MPRVTSLEPRTPHQPGKLQKVSKNEYGFTLFSFGVNEKCGIVSSDFSIECREFTGRCSESGAVPAWSGLGDMRGSAIFQENYRLERLSVVDRSLECACENHGQNRGGLDISEFSMRVYGSILSSRSRGENVASYVSTVITYHCFSCFVRGEVECPFPGNHT
jgi:hypothetical protein